MVPNPQGGGVGARTFYVRGLPGVGIYIAGVWQSSYGFLESELCGGRARRGSARPARNAVRPQHQRRRDNITTRPLGEEFGVRMGFEVGKFDRRNASIAVDLPLGETLKSKWMLELQERRLSREPYRPPLARRPRRPVAALRSLVGAHRQLPHAIHCQRRGQERHRGSDRAHHERAQRALHPVQRDGRQPGLREHSRLHANQLGVPGDAFTPETHMPGYPGGELGKWQTKSDTPAQGHYAVTTTKAVRFRIPRPTDSGPWCRAANRWAISMPGTRASRMRTRTSART